MEFVLDEEGILRRVKKEEVSNDLKGKLFSIEDTEEITIPEGTRELQFNKNIRFTSDMFFCKNTKKVILPDGLEIIGKESFSNWENLETVCLPESIKTIGDYAFYKTAIKNIHIPDGVESIGDYAFGMCEKLKEIVLPESTTETWPSMLNGCKSLKSFHIPSYVTTMFELSDCGFESIIVPEGIESLWAGSFENCENLKYVEFPSTLQREELYAFDGCTVIEEITFKKYLKPFTISLANLSSLKRLNVPQKEAVKAKLQFPNLIIGDLEGNIVYTANDQVSDKDKPVERKKATKKLDDPMDDTKLHNRSIEIEQNGIAFHIDIKGTGAITKTVNKFIKAAKEKDATSFYDPKELVRLNLGNLFEIETHSGVLIHTLGQDRGACQMPGEYSAPISAEDVIQRANDFQSKALKCLSNESIELILSKLPHKKNGTLHKKRITCILKFNCVDEDAMMCVIYAKNLDDTVVEINVKQFYVGDDISQSNELSTEI